MIWNDGIYPDGNAGEWECARTLSSGTSAFKECVPKAQMEKFIPSVPFFINDCYIAWELYRWQKDASDPERAPLVEDDFEMGAK